LPFSDANTRESLRGQVDESDVAANLHVQFVCGVGAGPIEVEAQHSAAKRIEEGKRVELGGRRLR
jgi:hypothetical protein